MSRNKTTRQAEKVSVSVQAFREPQSRDPLLWVAIGLCVLTFAVFIQTVKFGFIGIDDSSYVFENPSIKEGFSLKGIEYAFTAYSPNWHPVTWFSHMLDCQLFGLDAGWHHLTNIVLHTANVLILLFLLLRLTGAFWRSAVVAALFAVHPLHVESVAWIAERKDLLSCLFWLLTIWMYADYAKGIDARKKYVLALVFFVLGLMSKPSVVTLPFALLLLDYWPLQRVSSASIGSLLKEKIPFFLLSLASSGITYVGQMLQNAVAHPPGRGIRMANALQSYVLYLRDLVWPQSLAALYPYPRGISGIDIFLSVLILAIITASAIWFARRSPYLPIGWLWFLGVMVPMIGFVQVGWQARADRYTYISSIGIFVMVVWGVEQAARHYRVPLKPLLGAAAVIVLAFAARSWDQVSYWKNNDALFNRTITITGRNPVAKYWFGECLDADHRLPEAELNYRGAIQDDPGFAEPYLNLGYDLFAERKWSEALNTLTQALVLKPDTPLAIYRRAVALSYLGRIPEAIQGVQLTLTYHPQPGEEAAQREFLGQLWLLAGQNQAALTELDKALALNPKLEEARINRARALAALNKEK